MLTSVVHEFSVLYSNRVHQKDKKWSDGRLKYYEFNRKIEILSEEMMLVASDFYPPGGKPPLESGVFEDGNTYKLPNGKVIVEFAEYLGCKERDILKMFVKLDSKQNQSTLVPERPIKVVSHVKVESPISAIKRSPRIGLGRPKKHSRQLEVTRFVLRLSSEEKLHKLQRRARPIGLRIPVGSNRMMARLYKELGIGLDSGVGQSVESREVSVPVTEEGGL